MKAKTRRLPKFFVTARKPGSIERIPVDQAGRALDILIKLELDGFSGNVIDENGRKATKAQLKKLKATEAAS